MLSAFGWGRPLVRVLRLADNDSLAVTVWSLAAGLFAAGGVLLGAAVAGWLQAGVLAAVTLVGSLSAVAELLCAYLGWTNGHLVDVRRAGQHASHGLPTRTQSRLIFALAGVVVGATFIAALAPPTSSWALSRTLEIPKAVWLDGRVAPGSAPSVNIVHMWYLWALALDGPVAANLIAWCSGVLVALATVLCARPLLGAERARLAGASGVLCPGVAYQMHAPAEELAAALLAALAASLALGATRSRAGGYALAAAVVLATAGVCLTGVLGPPASDRPMLAHLGPPAVVGLAGWALLAQRWEHRLLLAMTVAAAVAIAAVVEGAWWCLAVPFAAIGLLHAWHEIERLGRPARTVVGAALATVMLLAPVACVDAALQASWVAIGWQSRHEFLLSRVGTYRAASMLDRIGHRGDRVLCQDPRTLYLPCSTHSPRHLAESIGTANESLPEREAIALAQSGGCTYLLLAQGDAPEPRAASPCAAADSTELKSAANAITPSPIGQLIPILEYRFADDNNRFIRYRLLRLR
jgi:hypothetical protein